MVILSPPESEVILRLFCATVPERALSEFTIFETTPESDESSEFVVTRAHESELKFEVTTPESDESPS